MAVAFRASAEAAATAAATSLLVAVPTGTANDDVLIWFFRCASTGSGGFTPPAGWTVLDESANSIILYRIASSEPANYTMTYTASVESATIMHAFSGADTTNPILSLAYLPAGSNAPPVRELFFPATDGALVAFAGFNRGSLTTAAPSGYTQAGNPDSGGTGSGATEVNGGYKIITGGTGAATSFTGAAAAETFHLMLRAAATPLPLALRHERFASAASSPASLACQVPFLKAADAIYAIVTTLGGSGATISPPASFVQLGSQENQSTNTATSVYRKTATGSEFPGTLTFSFSGATGVGILLFTTTPSGFVGTHGQASDATNDTTVNVPAMGALTAQTPDAIVVAFAGTNPQLGAASTAPSGYTKVRFDGIPGTRGSNFALKFYGSTTPGATSFTASGSNATNTAFHFAVHPSGPGGTARPRFYASVIG